MGYKKYVDKNHQYYINDNMGDDILNGIGEGLEVGKALGLDKQAKKDIQRIKGYSDAEINEMDLTEAKKEYKSLHIKFIILAVCSVLLILSSFSTGDKMVFNLLLGAVCGVFAFRFYNQQKKLKEKIDKSSK
ncbi:MAG: hypothetical protein IKM49_06110 [Ruminococcus sp.]|nr:hypothetical protein [Ruminococcus sp.]